MQFIKDWLVANRLIFDRDVHGLRPLIGNLRKEQIPERKTQQKEVDDFRFVGRHQRRAKVAVTDRTSEWNFEVDRNSRVSLNSRDEKITALDELWIMYKLKYKSWDTFDKSLSIFEQIKIRWSREMSNKDIEKDFLKLEIDCKESTIKKVTFAFNRSHEENEGTLDVEKHTPLSSKLSQT